MKNTILAISTLLLLISFNTYSAEKMGKKGKSMAHLSPMPNLMRVIKKFEKELDLSNEQKAKLKTWRKTNGPKVKRLKKTVISAENKVRMMALSDASSEKLLTQYVSIEKLRSDIAKKKIECRENMRTTLSEKQFNKVLAIYKERFLKK